MHGKTLRSFGRKAIAVLMALCLSVMMVPAIAFASIEYRDYEVEVDASAADASATQGDISTAKNGVGVLAKDGHTGTATVGNVNAAGTEEAPVSRGIYANANGGNAIVKAGAVTGSYNSAVVWLCGNDAIGNVELDSLNATLLKDGYAKNNAIYSDASKNADLNVKVNGGVTVPAGVQGYTTAVYVKTTQPSAKSTVTIGGDVSVTDADRVLYVENNNGGTAKLTAGNVTATDVGNGNYQKSAVCANANNGTAELTMGNLKGLGGTYVGMKAYANHGGTLTVNAGDISVEQEGGNGYSGSYGLDGSTSDAGSVANVTVGNIAAKHSGVNLSANGGSTLNLKTGDISGAQYNNLSVDGGTLNAELGAITGAQHTGLDISGKATEGSKYTVTTGPITSENSALSLYTYAPADNPDKITVNGDLTSAGGDYNGAGIYASSSAGYIDLTVNGNVTSDYRTVQGSLGGTTVITGDVISTHDGDYVPAIGSVAGKVPLDLLVAGTISSNGPALDNNAENYSRTTLTAWKIASANAKLFNGDDEAGTFAKTVNYIVKTEEPKMAGVTLQGVKADGTPLATSHDLPVAHEGETVYLKADLPSCVKVVKAYNGVGEDKIELPQDASGRYYYTVPQGGGVYLSVDLEEDHSWEVGFRWDGDVESGYTAATAYFQCTKDPSHQIMVDTVISEETVAPTCSSEGYTRYTATVPATSSPDGTEYTDSQDAKYVPVDPDAHIWGDWVVVKEPSPTKPGVRKRTCELDASHVEKQKIEASGKLLVKMTAKGKKVLKISWSSVKNANGYEIYFAKCNHKNEKNYCVKVKTIESGDAGSWAIKKLKKQTPYKMFVMAYKIVDGNKVYMDTSLTAHAFSSGGDAKFTNPKSVVLQQKTLDLEKGATATIEATVTKLQENKKLISQGHAPTKRYISSNTKIAKVSKDGVVTAKKSGSCKVYVIAANGVRKAVKVNVA